MVKEIEHTKKLTEKFVAKTLWLLGVDVEIRVEVGDNIEINITGEDLGLLIGSRGEHLESLQAFFNIAINKKLGDEWKAVVLDIGNWRRDKEEELRALVSKEVAKLDSANKETILPPMPSSQRRTVHIIASEYKGIVSSSVGDEPERRIVLRKVV